MSVVVVKIKNKGKHFLAKKLVAALNEKASDLSDEEYRDSMFSKLLEEENPSCYPLLRQKEN